MIMYFWYLFPIMIGIGMIGVGSKDDLFILKLMGTAMILYGLVLMFLLYQQRQKDKCSFNPRRRYQSRIND